MRHFTFFRATLVPGLLLMCAGAAAAQTLSIATSPAGSLNHSLGNALGKVMSDAAKMQARVVPYGGGQKILPSIDAGRFELAILSSTDIFFAYTGKEEFKGHEAKKIRLIGTVFPYYLSWIVRKDAPYKTIADLKGKKVAVGYTANVSQRRSVLSQMAFAGLKESDFDGVQVPHVVRGADDLAQGKVESTSFAIGAGKVAEINAKISGGIRYLDVPNDDASVARMRAIMPLGGVKLIQPEPGFVGIDKPTWVQTEYYAVTTGTHLSEENAYKVAKMLHDNRADLAKIAASFKRVEPQDLVRDSGAPFHPGAIRFYKEKGLWPADRK